jgi:hypothetical protein
MCSAVQKDHANFVPRFGCACMRGKNLRGGIGCPFWWAQNLELPRNTAEVCRRCSKYSDNQKDRANVVPEVGCACRHVEQEPHRGASDALFGVGP